ncbi:MAG: alkaline phosphatase family protein [Candidatus Coatesbacteria bacterium]|nr:alkaline phosphatase family protein [Candidatus Coatesbacteria bacterium]
MNRRTFLKILPFIPGVFYASCKTKKLSFKVNQSSRLIFMGLDGLEWSIVNKLRKEEQMPNLDFLIRNGASGILKSFQPMYSPIIWTTMLSGTTPELHGINSFVARLSGSGARTETILPGLDIDDYSAKIKVMSCPGLKEQNLKILFNSKEVASLKLIPEWIEYDFKIPKDVIDRKRNILTFVHDNIARIEVKEELKTYFEIMNTITKKDSLDKRELVEEEFAQKEIEKIFGNEPTITLTAAYEKISLFDSRNNKFEFQFGEEKNYTKLRIGWYTSPNASFDFLWAGRDKIIPVSSAQRKRPLLWEIISSCGGSAGSIGFWTTWPASKINPFLITDNLCYMNIINRDIDNSTRNEGLTYPKYLAESLSKYVYNIEDIKNDYLKEYITSSSAYELEQSYTQDMHLLKEAHSLYLTYGEIASFLQQKYLPQSLFVYLRSTDIVSHYFWDSIEPEAFKNAKEKHVKAFSKTIYQMYINADKLIGRFLKKYRDYNFVICSDHGFRASPEMKTKGWHKIEGFMCFHGNDFRKAAKLPDSEMIDITPTLLHLMGLPKASDMKGRIIEEAFNRKLLNDNNSLVKTVADPYSLPDGTKTPSESNYDEEIKRRLKSLGYIN